MERSRLILIVLGVVAVLGIGAYVLSAAGGPEPVSVDGGIKDRRVDGSDGGKVDPGDGVDEQRETAGQLSVEVPQGYEGRSIRSDLAQQIVIRRPGSGTPAAVVARADSPAPTTDEYIGIITASGQDGSVPASEPVEIAGQTGRLIEFEVPDIGKLRYVAAVVIDGKAVTVTTEGPTSSKDSLRRLALELAGTAAVSR